jgi:two-component system, LytTR family, sensor kinase
MERVIGRISKYWLFQMLGWGMFVGVNIFFAITYNLYDNLFITRLSLYLVVGVLMSHLMRMAIHRLYLMQRAVNLQLIGFILVSVFFAIIVGLMETYLSSFFSLEYKEEVIMPMRQKISTNIFTSFIYFFIWNCIYFIYHYVEQSRKNQFDNLKLEAMVKSLELKTIKANINPHFIFNALNSIRALIDEDPSRARVSVTSLGNILRSSMLSDQLETITLEKELDIVADYLALELIRFEDRLKVVHEIEEDALDNPVPPMMLQTLVENAIKHGIGKSVNPGTIKIIAKEVDNLFYLQVVNTGKLDMTKDHEGFGLQSTSTRLDLIFAGKASFSLAQANDHEVQAEVIIPLN